MMCDKLIRDYHDRGKKKYRYTIKSRYEVYYADDYDDDKFIKSGGVTVVDNEWDTDKVDFKTTPYMTVYNLMGKVEYYATPDTFTSIDGYPSKSAASMVKINGEKVTTTYISESRIQNGWVDYNHNTGLLSLRYGGFAIDIYNQHVGTLRYKGKVGKLEIDKRTSKYKDVADVVVTLIKGMRRDKYKGFFSELDDIVSSIFECDARFIKGKE